MSGREEVAYVENLHAQEAAYWESRRQRMGLTDKQIGDLLRAAAPHLHEPDELLRFTATADELRAIAHAFNVLELAYANVMLTWRDGSPWIEVAAVPTRAHAVASSSPTELTTYEPIRLALWRRTRAVHLVEPDGAVVEDPLPGCEGVTGG